MLIDIATLPEELQAHILSVQHGNIVQFTQNGEIVASVKKQDSLLATAGIWKSHNIDGVAYQNAIRQEWEREWD